MKKILKSKSLPIILMISEILAVIMFNSFNVMWVFMNNTVKIDGFATMLLSLMAANMLVLTVLSALRVYKTDITDKKFYAPVLVIATLLAAVSFIYTAIVSITFLLGEQQTTYICGFKEAVSESIGLIAAGLLVIFYPALGCKAKKSVAAVTLILVLLLGLNKFYPLSSYKITSTPMVIDNGKEYSVVFSTSSRGTAFVEYTYEGKDYKIFDQSGGRLNTESKIHSIPVPYEHLKGNTYTVGSTRVIDEFSYGSRLGKTVNSEEYTFTVNESENQKWLVVSDWHTMLDKAYSAIGNLDEYDAVVLLGDATPGVDFEDEVVRNIVQFGGEVSKGTMPVIYTRGNHETRGAYANDLADALGIDEFYHTANVGDYSFIILDSGEDKDDSHSEYGGMTDYNSYRASMIEWLKTAEVETDKVITFCHSWRISDVENELSVSGWNEIDRLGARIMISGHEHECRFLGDKDGYEKENFEAHPDIIGYLDGGKCDKGYVASMLTLSPDGFNIKAVSYQGEEIFDEDFSW